MIKNVIDRAVDLIKINSVSSNSNREIIEYIGNLLDQNGFELEVLTYKDSNSVEKYNFVAKKGDKPNGLVFLMHSDTVPLAKEDQLEPYIENGRLYGRGSCDMKGPIAAALNAIIDTKSDETIVVVVTSDEETGCEGASFLARESILLKKIRPLWGIATEPTELKPVYAHKGIGQIVVTAYGKAAHSSTTEGDSANFKLIPFLHFISRLKEKYNIDKSYQNSIFNPPTNSLNITITDFNCAMNVTAAKSRCKICFRAMPDARTNDVIKEIEDEAKRLNLEVSSALYDSLHTDPESDFVKLAESISGNRGETVAYLTDASQFSSSFKSIILGPGSIKQAHTECEFIDIEELKQGYDIYKKIIENYRVN